MTLIRPALGVLALAAIAEFGSVLAGATVSELLLHLPGIDKVLHFAVLFGLFIACAWAQRRFFPTMPGGLPLVALLLLLLALGDEAVQAFSPTRSLELADVAAGICGLVAAGSWVGRGRHPAWAAATGFAAIGLAGYIAVDSFSVQRHVSAGIRLSRAGDFIGARSAYRAALAAGARTANVYNELSWVEIESGVGDPSAAVAFAEQALVMRPGDVDILDTYGWALHHAGRSAEALPHLEQAYAAKPDMFCIHYHLGEVYLALAQHDRAADHLRMQVRRTGTREAARAAQTLAARGW